MSFLQKSTSQSTRPERDNSGVIFPEIILYNIIKPIALTLSKGEYAKGSLHEPIISSFVGLPQEVIEGVFKALIRQPVRVSYAFPYETKLLPYITLQLESLDTTGTMIGNDAGFANETTSTMDTPIVLILSASGGETEVFLPNKPIVAHSVELIRTRAGSDTDLLEVTQDFTLDIDEGKITLADPLIAGDTLTVNEYKYYNIPGGDYFGANMSFSVVIFVDTLNPLTTNALTGIIWRELMVNQDTLEEYGLTDINFSIRTNSLWDQAVPSIGVRKELIITGTCEWYAYNMQVSARTISFDFDGTDGSEDLVLYQDELASLGIVDLGDDGENNL